MINRAILFALLCVTVETFFAVPYLSGELLFGPAMGPLLVAAALGTAVIMTLGAWRLQDRLARYLDRTAERLTRIPTWAWLLGVVVAGLAIRVVWLSVFPAPLVSDSEVYLSLARRLLGGGSYQDPRGEFAFWPPGYPFALYAFMRVTGEHAWVPTGMNLLLFVTMVPLVHALGNRVAGLKGARIGTLLLLAWPNYTFLAGTGSKEVLLAALISFAVIAYAASTRVHMSLARAFLVASCGAALALGGLTQPGTLLLIFAFPLYDLLRRAPFRTVVSAWLILFVVFGALVGLWTARNIRVLGEPVLVSTNGGSIFYRTNNPLAWGGYAPQGERSLKGLGELERDRLGFQWGLEWIGSHPLAFLGLAVRKQILFLGDDGDGAHLTLKWGLGISGIRYLVAKALSNAFWLLLWGLIAVAVLRRLRGGAHDPAFLSLLILEVLYFFAVDSVFESGSRHHIPLIGILAALPALALGGPGAGAGSEGGRQEEPGPERRPGLQRA